jgi:hypothetical protein
LRRGVTGRLTGTPSGPANQALTTEMSAGFAYHSRAFALVSEFLPKCPCAGSEREGLRYPGEWQRN